MCVMHTELVADTVPSHHASECRLEGVVRMSSWSVQPYYPLEDGRVWFRIYWCQILPVFGPKWNYQNYIWPWTECSFSGIPYVANSLISSHGIPTASWSFIGMASAHLVKYSCTTSTVYSGCCYMNVVPQEHLLQLFAVVVQWVCWWEVPAEVQIVCLVGT